MTDLNNIVKPLAWSWNERAGLFEAENPVTFITMYAATEEDCEDSNARYAARILAAIDTDAVGALVEAAEWALPVLERHVTHPNDQDDLEGFCAALAPKQLAPQSAPDHVVKDAQAFDDMSRVADTWMHKVDDLRREIDMLSDPNVVHLNMLRGTIAKPSVDQIIHLYGVDALVAALAPVIVREAGREPAPSEWNAAIEAAAKALDALPEAGSADFNMGISRAYSVVLALRKGTDHE